VDCGEVNLRIQGNAVSTARYTNHPKRAVQAQIGDPSPLTCEIARWPILCSSSENRRSRLKVDSVIALSQPIRNPPPNTESGRRIKLMRPNPSGYRYARNASEPRKEVMSVAMIVSSISRGGILSVIGKECKLAQRRI
jgi:hypothetical protein